MVFLYNNQYFIHFLVLKRTNSNNQYALAFRKKGLCYLNSHNNNNENDDNISHISLKYYRKASMIDLNLAEEYYCKGYILKKEKKLNEANEYFRKAIELNPDLDVKSLISFEESIKEEGAVEYDFDLENKKDDFLPQSADGLKSTEVNDNDNDESKKEVLKLFRNRNLIGNDFLIKKLENNNTDFDD